MLLLDQIVADSLDQGYARAAARRAATGRPAGHGRLLTVGLLACGLLLSVAAVHAQRRSSTAVEARDALVTEIRDRQGGSDRLQQRLVRLRAQVSAERARALAITGAGGVLADRLLQLEAATGAGAVSGPGLTLHLEDAPEPADTGADTDPRTSTGEEGRVTDRDLQTLVNQLWAAGAEAIAINGQRLTTLSAIRAAGEAILVDFRPLAPPYDVDVIGPPEMQTRFAAGFGGSYLQVLRDYGIRYELTGRDSLDLPASAGLRLLTAKPLVGSAPTTSPSTQTERETR